MKLTFFSFAAHLSGMDIDDHSSPVLKDPGFSGHLNKQSPQDSQPSTLGSNNKDGFATQIDNIIDLRIAESKKAGKALTKEEERQIIREVFQDNITDLKFFLRNIQNDSKYFSDSKYFNKHRKGIFNGGLCKKIIDNDWLNAFEDAVENDFITLGHDVFDCNAPLGKKQLAPIQYAIVNKKKLIFNYLAEKQKNELAAIKTSNGYTLLHLAAESKNTEAFNTLKNTYQLDNSVKNNNGKTPNDLLQTSSLPSGGLTPTTTETPPNSIPPATTQPTDDSLLANTKVFLADMRPHILPLSCFAGAVVCLYFYFKPADTDDDIDNSVPAAA